ncbi:MAG: PAS domain S-box protein [Anaerolineales bacterium]|nr:PAS domain S-box protein [Anaerolineales bacterium]
MKKKTTEFRKPPRKKAAPPARSSKPGTRKPQSPNRDKPIWDDDRAFRVLVQNSAEIFTFVDDRGRILYRSPSVRRVLHRPDGQVLHSNLMEWIWPEDKRETERLFAQILRSPGKTVPFEGRIRDASGDPRWIEGYGVNHLDNPAVGAILVNYHDVTERKDQERQLRENERRYRELFEQAVVPVFQSAFDGKIIRVNPAFARLFGYASPEELYASVRDAAELFADPARRAEIIRLKEEDPARDKFENLYRRKDGSAFWGLLSVRTVNDAEGRPAFFEGFIEDIDQRKRAESALRDSFEKFRSIFENSSVGITLFGMDRRYRMVNPAFCAITGYGEEELLGMEFLDITHPEDVESSRRVMQDVLEGGGRTVRFAKRYVRKDGGTVWADVSSAVVFGADGKPSHFVTHVLDVTDRLKTEEALWKSEGRAGAMVASAPYGVTFVDGDGRVTYANAAAERILGLQKSRIVGRAYDDPEWKITAPDGGPFPPEELPFPRVKSSGKPVYDIEHAVERETGERTVLSVNGAPLCAPDGSFAGMVSAIRDITAERQAELALRESEERYRSLFDHSLEGIGLSQGNRIVDVNRSLLEIFGYDDLEEFRSIPLMDHLAPESRETVRRMMEEARGGTVTDRRFTYSVIRKDGLRRELEISTSHLWLGKTLYTLSTFRDITEKQKAENELRALALRHQALLDAIPEIVMEVDARKVYIWANPAGLSFFGADVVGKEAAEYFEGEQDTYARVQSVINGTEDTIYVESWQRRRDGQKRLLAWWCRTLRNGRGEAAGALSSARDITEQRQAEEQIENLSRFPMENPNPVMRFAPDGVLLFANTASRSFLDLWRIAPGQAVPGGFRARLGEAYERNEIRDVETAVADRVFSCFLTPVRKAGYVNVYGRDITEIKQARSALERQAEELRSRNEELARLNALNENQVRRLTAMRAIDTAIASSFKLELVLNILLGQLTDLLNVPAADVLIYQPDLQTFRMACARGFRGPLPLQSYPRKMDSYANQATQSRRLVRVPRLEERTDGAKIYPKIAGEEFRSYLCLPLLTKGSAKGVLELFFRDSSELDADAESFLGLVAGQAAIAIDNAELFEGLQASNDELNLAYNDTLTGWARTLELREHSMEGESQRLADWTVRLAKALGCGDKELTHIYRGAILHDIGMMGIPESILRKAEPLSQEDWEVLRGHPVHARDLLASVNYLRPAIDIPYCHHERWDGTGYPRGLSGTQIPWAARIFAVVDVWDAMRSARPYRPAWSDSDARDYIHRQAGGHFDPKVVEAFFEVVAGG